MEYYNLSNNIIACDNFLPQQQVDELFTDILNNRKNFNIPNWSQSNKHQTSELYSSKCGGFDFWLADRTQKDNNSFIESLNKWFLHMGLFFYMKKNSPDCFEFLHRRLKWDIHVICYNNGGYYNWHKDEMNNNLFTFNLVLNKGNSLKGGDMFFMDKGKIIKVKNQNNFMTLFPSYIPHAITPLYSENNQDVSFLEQRFSIQFWISLQ
jgi:hypothetical protein